MVNAREILKLSNQNMAITKTINDHYAKKENFEVIEKTVLAFEMMLAVGLPSLECTLKMRDMGVKDTELGLSMALAMKKTDDSCLSPLDQNIKKLVMETHKKMIEELEDLLK